LSIHYRHPQLFRLRGVDQHSLHFCCGPCRSTAAIRTPDLCAAA
jgi:hypothetical protein